MALRRNEQGVVKFKVHVSADSRVTEVELLQSSGSRILDKATLEHFKDACFKAAVDASGSPVASTATVEYVWRLE